MLIDNSAYTLKDRKLMYLMTLSLPVFIPIFLLSDFFDTPVLRIPKEVYAAGVVVIYILFHVYRIILDLNYIQISNTDGKLIVRYYSLMPLAKKHKSIEMSLNTFSNYKLSTSFFGMKKTLLLYQKVQGRLAKYPPLSVSVLTNEEIEKLKSMLDALTIKN